MPRPNLTGLLLMALLGSAAGEEVPVLKYECDGGKQFIQVRRDPKTGEIRGTLGQYRPTQGVTSVSCGYFEGVGLTDTGRPGKREDVFVLQGLWDHCSMGKLLIVNRPWRTPQGSTQLRALVVDAGNLEVLERLACAER